VVILALEDGAMAHNQNSQRTFAILVVDLSTGESFEYTPDETDQRRFLGGASLGSKLLYPYMDPSLDPYDPAAPLLFMTGPLTGTVGPAVGRFVVCGKSPATGLWGESNIGGFFGPELREAGFDGLLILGRSQEPVYLSIRDGAVAIVPAEHLWGLDPYTTQDRIRADLADPRVRVATIGVAGETQIPFALILCDHGRVAGRTGLGAVMGSKKLKAVAVRGTSAIPLTKPKEFSKLRTEVNRSLRDDVVSVGMRDFGTASGSDIFDYFGMMPKHYFSRGTIENVDRISGMMMAETILTGVSACHGCVIACGRKVTLSDGEERKGPEYESTIGFGPNLGITNLEAITRFCELCDYFGMDTISLSNTIGLAYLLYERGDISEADTDGDSLRWGNEEVVEGLIKRTARREGFGERIAEGARALARFYGVPELAAHVHGLEIPFHDPRGASGMALVYATSPRGACHNQGYYYMVEMGQTLEEVGVQLLPRTTAEGKAENVARHQDWTSVANSLVLCIFSTVPPSEICELANLATGFDMDLQEFLMVGERAWNLKRLINLNLGMDLENERLPEHLMLPLIEGNVTGMTPPFEELITDYYKFRDWNAQTGRPSKSKIDALDLDEVELTQRLFE
jgi:aldehyde:ferredoxin oxidoreductase